jgi:hypothetical protein
MKPYHLLLIFLLFPLLGTKSKENSNIKPTKERTGKDYAVFFYVSEYQDKGWTPLPETKIECENIEKELRENYGFETEIIRNPTRQQIQDKIRAYNELKYSPDDQVLFFFSMHGYYIENANRGYLVAKDGDYGTQYPNSYYSYDELGTDLAFSNCQHILLGLDACYSGSFGIRNKGGPSGPDYEQESDCLQKLNKALKHKSRLFFSSGSKNDKTPAKSLFASKWLEALRDGGETGLVRAKNLALLFNDIESPVPESGTFSGHEEKGDFVFVKKGYCVENAEERKVTPNAVDIDEEAWAEYKREGTTKAYEDYIRFVKSGKHIAEAKEAIKALKDREIRQISNYLACNDEVKVQLNSDRKISLTSELILDTEGAKYDYENMYVEVKRAGKWEKGDLTIEDASKKLECRVVNRVTKNSCWGNVVVEGVGKNYITNTKRDYFGDEEPEIFFGDEMPDIITQLVQNMILVKGGTFTMGCTTE